MRRSLSDLERARWETVARLLPRSAQAPSIVRAAEKLLHAATLDLAEPPAQALIPPPAPGTTIPSELNIIPPPGETTIPPTEPTIIPPESVAVLVAAASTSAPTDTPDIPAGLFLGALSWTRRGAPATERAVVSAFPTPLHPQMPARAWFSTQVSWSQRQAVASDMPQPSIVTFMAMATGQALQTARRREARPPAANRFFRAVSWSRRPQPTPQQNVGSRP